MKREPSGVYSYCGSCGYKELLHEITPPSGLNASVNLNKTHESKPIRSKLISNSDKPKKKFSNFSTSTPKPKTTSNTSDSEKNDEENAFEKVKQTLLLMEIRKNNTFNLVETFNGPKRVEMLLDALSVLQKIQDLKIQYNYYQLEGYTSDDLESDSTSKSTSAVSTEPAKDSVMNNSNNPNTPVIEPYIEKEKPVENAEEKAPTRTILIDSSKKILELIDMIKDKIFVAFPDLTFKKDRFFAWFDTEIENANVCALYPNKNQIWMVNRILGASDNQLARHVSIIDTIEKFDEAFIHVKQSYDAVQRYLKNWSKF
jgi:hypothetical protein